jgi:hypothetical protein
MFRPIRVDHTKCLQVAIKTHSFIMQMVIKKRVRGTPTTIVRCAGREQTYCLYCNGKSEHQEEEEPASLWAFLSPIFRDPTSSTPRGTQQVRDRCPPGATSPQGRNQSFRWRCSLCHRSCHYLNQERLAEASCGCITGRMERALSSACCVFRGIHDPGRWCRYWQGGVSERVSDRLARGLGCCKIQRETSRLIRLC